MKKLAVIKPSAKTYTLKKVNKKALKKGTYYKLMLVAYDKDNKVLASSKVIHVATAGGKVGNHKAVTVAKKAAKGKLTLQVGNSFKLKAKATAASKTKKVKKHRVITYESSNKSVATVTKNGVIKAKKAGKCTIYAYAQNGIYKKITVTVPNAKSANSKSNSALAV